MGRVAQEQRSGVGGKLDKAGCHVCQFVLFRNPNMVKYFNEHSKKTRPGGMPEHGYDKYRSHMSPRPLKNSRLRWTSPA